MRLCVCVCVCASMCVCVCVSYTDACMKLVMESKKLSEVDVGSFDAVFL